MRFSLIKRLHNTEFTTGVNLGLRIYTVRKRNLPGLILNALCICFLFLVWLVLRFCHFDCQYPCKLSIGLFFAPWPLKDLFLGKFSLFWIWFIFCGVPPSGIFGLDAELACFNILIVCTYSSNFCCLRLLSSYKFWFSVLRSLMISWYFAKWWESKTYRFYRCIHGAACFRCQEADPHVLSFSHPVSERILFLFLDTFGRVGLHTAVVGIP